jgi:hypothetical protein
MGGVNGLVLFMRDSQAKRITPAGPGVRGGPAKRLPEGGTMLLRACPMLNIHHLELFFYVARHGGISRAVRP